MKEQIAQSTMKKFRDFIDDGTSTRYTQRYNGVVEDNNDPERNGRCKIRVMGLYDGILTEYLPWALPDFNFVGSAKGSFIVPENGAVVNVYYDDGDIYQPRYFSKTLDLKNFSFEADKNEDYPNSMVFWETEQGDFSKFNREKGEYTLRTHNGVFVKVFESGIIEISNDSTDVGDMTLNLRGNFNINNPFGNINIFTNNFSLSGFGDMNIVNNGSTKIHSLNNAEIAVNGNCDIIAGGETKVSAKDKCVVEAIQCDVLANEINFDIATSTTTTYDISGVPDPIASEKTSSFEMNVGSPESVPFMSVSPSILGGPFNTMLFDPLTGELHQGRTLTGIVGVKNDTTQKLEIAKQKTIIETQRAKALVDSSMDITKKYNSVTEKTKLAVSGPAAVAFTQKKMVDEIKEAAKNINVEYDKKIKDVETTYGSHLTKPVFGTILDPDTPQEKSALHTTKIPKAEAEALLDPTNKTTYYDLIGPSGGFNNMEQE